MLPHKDLADCLLAAAILIKWSSITAHVKYSDNVTTRI